MHLFLIAVGFGVVSTAILALAAVGFTLQFGVTNILNLAYGATMTTAAFAVYECNRAGLSVWAGLAVGGASGAVLSVGLNEVIFRPFQRRGLQLFSMIMVTLAVGIIIQHTIEVFWGPGNFYYNMPISSSHHVMGMILTTDQIYIVGLSLAAMLLVHVLLRWTRLGKAMRATSSNPRLAMACGVPIGRITNVAWLLSGLLAGLAGVVLVANVQNLQASTGTDFVVLIIAAAVLGGIGSPYGAMLGALVIGMVSEISAAYIDPGLKDVVAFGILGLTLLIRPTGIVSAVAAGKGVTASG